MAAHVDITDTEFHTESIGISTARGIDGPVGASVCWVYVNHASAVVYAQVGSVVDGTTDISTDGGPLPNQSWVGIPCDVQDAPASAANRPAVYFQSDTASTDVRYRFTHKAGDAS